MEQVIVAVAVAGSVCFIGLAGLTCYVLISRRKKQRMELLPRGYVYNSSPNGGGESVTSQDPVVAKDTSNKPNLPTLRLKVPPRSSEPTMQNMLPYNPMRPDSYYGDVPTQPQDNPQGEEARGAFEMEALSRQTTQYSRTSTLIAEADSTPSVSGATQQHSTRRKLRRMTAPVPPVPQLPPYVLHTPLTEAINIRGESDGYGHRPGQRDLD
ncbi:hypothetical protein P691DRAFT_427064 [Macrolepiota fuliginosa MF-IS2]|uniref:Uncharacterized protein n=1 Tax=Macrolepiota fuliginosa MF-IS2 TaxID=1400762 RepID=A0A9P5X4F4_9AGAR|nr:hypothetical protein P691DRAFT_427064 [Macrolepiota fuliginosa MF-IS2]